MAAAYLKHEPWEMGVHKRNGVVYLMCINDRKGQKVSWTFNCGFFIRCYWGYCFENLATEDPRRANGEGIHHVLCGVKDES
ncbi:hypothetical protein ACOSQ2_031511 [Xanthoceras sorbifolium]